MGERPIIDKALDSKIFRTLQRKQHRFFEVGAVSPYDDAIIQRIYQLLIKAS